MFQVRHKLDQKIYALKKVALHVRFDEDSDCPITQHPAMKEIEAISKLQHKNIVGYRGCWIESEDVDTEELNRILRRLNRNKPRFGNSIEESDSDDPEFRKFQEINQEQEDRAFHQKTYDEDEESDNEF